MSKGSQMVTVKLAGMSGDHSQAPSSPGSFNRRRAYGTCREGSSSQLHGPSLPCPEPSPPTSTWAGGGSHICRYT